MSLNNRILAFAYDAGGANLVMAYAYYMYKKGHNIKCYPKGPAVKIFENHIPFLISNEKVVFQKEDSVIIGTSGIHSDYEMNILLKAKKEELEVKCFLDSTSNLKLRFSLDNKFIEEKYLPDEIICENRSGFDSFPQIKKRVIYQENIYLKYLKNIFYPQILQTKNIDILKYQGEYLLILTEYLFELYGNRFGFTEYDVLENILSSIKKLSLDIPIFLKLHPAEKNDKYDELLNQYKLKVFKNDYNIQEVLYNSKIVFGLNSSVFKEALLLEKPVYSIQIDAIEDLGDMPNIEIISSKTQLEKVLQINFKGIK